MDFKSDLCDRNDLTMSRVKIEELNEIYKNLAEQIGFENTVVVYHIASVLVFRIIIEISPPKKTYKTILQ